jgi:hypothetical protein
MPTRAALILAGAALLAVATAVLLLRNPEPRYKGRTLEYWIQCNRQSPGDPDAREAIVSITTNNVPLLLQRLTADTSSEERLAAKVAASLRKNTIIRRFIIDHFLYRQRYRAACSVRAFRVSGTNAASAAPEVAQLLNGRYSLMVKTHAILILTEFGPSALPSIRQAMKNPDAHVRGMAVYAAGQLGTNAAPAIPDLVASLADADYSVRSTATNVLDTLAPELLPP